VDVLQSIDEFRVALEAHSGWETTPQTYVDGEFVGGSDILGELEERGDLADELNAEDADAASENADDGVQSPF
jgi:monothiol glutaredoxin